MSVLSPIEGLDSLPRRVADVKSGGRERYTDNPRDNPDAKPVRIVKDITLVREQGTFPLTQQPFLTYLHQRTHLMISTQSP